MRTDAVLCLLVGATLTGMSGHVAHAVELPVTCVAGSCGVTGPQTFVTSGAASAIQSGNSLQINQTSAQAILNWQSFNISSDGAVCFAQPDAGAVAVNRIFQADPSRIAGSLSANGQIYLINQNGIVFGNGAQVNVGGLVASTLNITPEALENGLARAAQSLRPAFDSFRGAEGERLASGEVTIEQSAVLTATGGQILMFAPQITNAGTIRTPDGQALLAAGETVYLAASGDPNLRGLLVEVDLGGTVTNGVEANANAATREALVGQIVAERGNVTLAGVAVNQLGRVSATTTVRQGGSIRLQARDGGSVQTGGEAPRLGATTGGTLSVGSRSITEVTLETASTDLTVDANAQPRSRIELDGKSVQLQQGSRIEAKGGSIDIVARANSVVSPDRFEVTEDGSRVLVEDGVVLDVSGADVSLPVERNLLRVELRGNQLRDSPLQREGPLRSEAVFVDIRESGVRADGSTWVGTPLADLAGDVSTIQRGVAERNLNGGSVSMQAQGDVIMSRNATVDISGGRIDYQDGFLDTTQLLGTDGRIYDISAADPNRAYVGIADRSTRTLPRFGVSETRRGFGYTDSRGRFEAGYVEGKDAGSLTISAPRAIIDGKIDGSVVRGRLQTMPSASVPQGAFYRSFDQVPTGGRLVIGNSIQTAGSDPNYVVDSVRVQSGLVLPALTNEDGTPFDAREDVLPDTIDEVRIRPELLGPDGVSEMTLLANDGLFIPQDVTLALPNGGRLSGTSSRVDIGADIVARGGSISFAARPTLTSPFGEVALTLRSTASLLARGLWINDSETLDPTRAALLPRHIDGGSVSLSARQGDVILEAGSLIDVTAGAFRTRNGEIDAGRGGSIDLAVSPGPLGEPGRLELGATLRGHALERGGDLAITAHSVCIASLNCASDDTGALWLTPEFLTQGGFETLNIASEGGGLELAAGTTLTLRQENLLFTRDPGLIRTGADMTTFTRIGGLNDELRRPMNLSLSAAIDAGDQVFNRTSFADAPLLRLGAGSLIAADPLASVSLAANSRIELAGAIVAPGGEVSVLLDNTLPVGDFLPSQAIWLGDGSRIDVSGLGRVVVDARGLRSGDVLDGGSVSLTAQRGYVIAQTGSLISVAGATANVDMRSVNGAAVRYAPQTIASAGGSIAISAAEGIVYSGEFAARGGSVPGAFTRPLDGSLSFTLDASQRSDPNEQGGASDSLFPIGPRTVSISQSLAPIVIGAGAAVPEAYSGRGLISADVIERAGFADVELAARNLSTKRLFQTEILPGVIEFVGDVSLSVGRSLAFDAATIAGSAGSQIVARAPYIAIGNSDRRNQQFSPPLLGSARLEVQAQLLDLVGNTTLSGFDDVRLASAGDLRMRGLQAPNARELVGALQTAADLALAATQIYPTTLSRYTISAGLGRDDGVLRVEPVGGTRADVLSAGGTLTLNASRIEQAGVLRAPFGAIDLQGEEIVLLAGSLTSTSAEGLTIPFGTTQGGFDWVFELEDGQNLVFDSLDTALPESRIDLAGDVVDIRAGATVDLSGGGDLLAYEFVPGTGGSRDVLSASVRPDQFAIVPGLDLQYAPYDPRESRGVGLAAGDSIDFAGAPGLPAGRYVLLPARYALLPGAFLVTAVEGYQDISAGERFSLLDGGIVAAGRHIVAGTSYADSRSTGFAIRAASQARRESNYTTTSANEFFDSADDSAAIRTRLPRDAGTLAIAAGSQLALEGVLRTAAAPMGRGAAVDIAGDRLLVVGADPAENDTPDVVLLDAASLNRLGVESLLLGGRRGSAVGGIAIDTLATSVTIDSGATLTAAELLLTARDQVALESGATLRAVASTAAGQRIGVTGDGGFVRVAGGEQSEVVRTGALGAIGVTRIEEGAALVAPGGSIAIDSSLDSSFAGTLSIADGALSLGASRINLGAAPDEAAGLTLDSASIAALGARELTLRGSSGIDFYGNVAFDVSSLSLDGPALRGFGEDADIFTIRSGDAIRLSSTSSAPSSDVGTGSGQLVLEAGTVELGAGAVDVSGFARTRLRATGDVIAIDDGSLNVAGDLALAAGRITTGKGVDAAWLATGDLAITRTTMRNAVSLADLAALGGRLEITARRIDHEGSIALPSGRLSLIANGSDPSDDVVIRSGAQIDLAGRVLTFDGVEVGSPGGTVILNAANGGIDVAAGSRIDVSAGGAAAAGSVSLKAVSGEIAVAGQLAGASGTGRGAEFAADGSTLIDFGSVNRTLNAGGFLGARSFRQRGEGDLVLAAGAENTLRAERVALVADGGGIIVNGAIDARSDGGGSVLLAARDDVTVTGRIDASALDASGRGGRIDLQTTSGGVILRRPAVIDVRAGEAGDGGLIALRLPRASIETLLDADAANDALQIAGTLSGARRIDVEGFKVYTDADGLLTAPEVAANTSNVRFREAQDFMARAADLRTALGRAEDPSFHVLPGVEIVSAGNLQLNADWNLSLWRFGPELLEPGILTLRAAGDLVFNRSLSDGFTAITGNAAFALPNTPSDSWSYRLAAGADVTSANLLAVQALADLPAESGNFRIAPGTISNNPSTASTFRMVRTGNGYIDVAAANDFVLGNRASVLYTAGVSGPGIRFGNRPGQLGSRAYPTDGGNVSINAGRDVVGAATNQFVTDWLWRVGRPDGATSPAATAWTVNFQRFEQNVGALGGGDLRVTAGRNVDGLNASIPSIGRQVGGITPAESVVDVTAGGRLDVRAGADIRGGGFYVGLGSASLDAGGRIGTRDGTEFTFAPLVGLGDGRVEMTARKDLAFEGIVNPTLLPQARSQVPNTTVASYFSTYAPTSRALLTAVAGDLQFLNSAGLAASLNSMNFADQTPLRVLPPTVQARALEGDAHLRGVMSLFPSPSGNLEIFAGDTIFGSDTLQLILSAADPAYLPSIEAPLTSSDRVREVLSTTLSSSPNFYAPNLLHRRQGSAASPLARLVAREGDIDITSVGVSDLSSLFLSRASRIVAGGDLVDVGVTIQHSNADDVSSLMAGGDVRYTVRRGPSGQILDSLREVVVEGPGTLQIAAGGNLDLQTSAGIATRGNLVDPALPSGGASISVLAGLKDTRPQNAAFIQKYLVDGSLYDAELLAFIGTSGGKQEALTRLRALSDEQQRPLIEKIFFAELRASGRSAAQSANQDYSRGFAALETLFPGSNPGNGQTNAYDGDIRLFFSRIYTLSGGNISLLAPGGEINVGLATPPAAFGVAKEPSRLGVVAQSDGSIDAFSYRDFQVNESRVFAADGGSILVWATDGDIDAGRGAKTAISAPPPTITIDSQGRARVTFPAALAGSGIQTIATTRGRKPGDVDLFAPRGVVNAGDAGIVAGNITIGAVAVVGANNITASGTSVGVPVSTSGISAAVANAGSAAAGATSAAASMSAQDTREAPSDSPLADGALGWLDVFVEGFGEEVCKANDVECLERNQQP